MSGVKFRAGIERCRELAFGGDQGSEVWDINRAIRNHTKGTSLIRIFQFFLLIFFSFKLEVKNISSGFLNLQRFLHKSLKWKMVTGICFSYRSRTILSRPDDWGVQSQ